MKWKLVQKPSFLELVDFENFIKGGSLNEFQNRIEGLHRAALFYLYFVEKKRSLVRKKPDNQAISMYHDFAKGGSLENISQKSKKTVSKSEQIIREIGSFGFNGYVIRNIWKSGIILCIISLIINILLVYVPVPIILFGQFINTGIIFFCSVIIFQPHYFSLHFRLNIAKLAFALNAIAIMCIFILFTIYPAFFSDNSPPITGVPWYWIWFVTLQYETNNAITLINSYFLFWSIQNWIYIIIWCYTVWDWARLKIKSKIHQNNIGFDLSSNTRIYAALETIDLDIDMIQVISMKTITKFPRAEILRCVKREWDEETFGFKETEIWKKESSLPTQLEKDLKKILNPPTTKNLKVGLVEILGDLQELVSKKTNKLVILQTIDRRSLEELRIEITSSQKSTTLIKEITRLLKYIDNIEDYKFPVWRKYIQNACRRIFEEYNLALTQSKMSPKKLSFLIMILIISMIFVSIWVGETLAAAVIGAIGSVLTTLFSKK